MKQGDKTRHVGVGSWPGSRQRALGSHLPEAKTAAVCGTGQGTGQPQSAGPHFLRSGKRLWINWLSPQHTDAGTDTHLSLRRVRQTLRRYVMMSLKENSPPLGFPASALFDLATQLSGSQGFST